MKGCHDVRDGSDGAKEKGGTQVRDKESCCQGGRKKDHRWQGASPEKGDAEENSCKSGSQEETCKKGG